jgi:hypothetical protein
MKQQMMENETGYGLEKKFGAVKIATLRSIPCTVSLSKDTFTFIDELFSII